MQGSPLNLEGNGQPARPRRRRYDDPPPSAPPDPPLTRKERQLRIALLLGAALFAVEAAIYLPDVFGDSPESRPFAINSVAKDVLFAALTALAAVDLRRLSRLLGLVILGHVVILVLLGSLLWFGPTNTVFPPPQWLVDIAPVTDVAPDVRLLVWLVSCAAATAVLVWLYGRALRERYELRYLLAPEHETVAALADAVLERPAVPPREIATAVDHYWASLDIEYKSRLRGALWIVCLSPLRRAKPPLPLMERGKRQRFIRERLLLEEPTRKSTKRLPMLVQSAVRFTMQMVYSAYYNDERSYEAVGYQRFSARSNYPGDPPAHRGLRTIDPADVKRWSREDVVVIGSGAGGAMVARELVRRGRSVLLLERGLHLERDKFEEDEARMYSRLYSDGALQTSRDFTFQVLQGMCVGGTTVVNNGVSFDIPRDVLGSWNTHHDTGLPENELHESFDKVRAVLKVVEQKTTPPNPVATRVNAGDRQSGRSALGRLAPVDANMQDCYGCGYCNIGCRFGKKLSMLDGVLPETQLWADEERKRRPEFSGRLEILAQCRVTEILKRGDRATGVRCRLRRPDCSSEEIEIAADTVVVSAGAIHSSRLLMQSGIGGPSVGTGLSANLGAHITADFGDEGDPIRAFNGLQMSHHLSDGRARDHLIETWFNPVMSQALVTPGWVGDHQRNMERYDRLGALGVLVGSEPNGHRVLRRRHLLNGSEVDFTPSATDIEKILRGLREAGEILLDAGAKHVMPLTFRYHELRSKEDLEDLENGALVKDASDISINTGHPQGGNAMGGNAEAVVDQRFRVRDYQNLYVVDASVFPTAINVNPQLTVMALAHRAGSQCIE
jgi:choline dehydrogenase-like flavoprotein